MLKKHNLSNETTMQQNTNQPNPVCHINLSRGTQDYLFNTKEVPAHGSGIQFQ